MTFSAKFSQSIIRVLLVIASVALMVMTVLVVANIIGRIFFKSPIFGIVEITGLAGVVVVAMAVGFAERERRNVIVAIVANKFPPRMRAIADTFTLFLSLGAVAFLSWAIFESAIKAAATGEFTSTLGITLAPFKFIWAIGILILCVFLAQHMVESLIRGVKKKV